LIVSLHFINIQDYVYEFIQYFLKKNKKKKDI